MLSSVRMSDLSTALALLGWLLYIGKVCGHIVDCAEMMPKIVRVARQVGHFLAKGFYFCGGLPRALWRRVSMFGSRLASLFRSRVDAATQTLCRYRIRNVPASIGTQTVYLGNVPASAGTQTDMTFNRCRGLVIDRRLSAFHSTFDV